jgi:mRNA-decapping enzyme subunit 2
VPINTIHTEAPRLQLRPSKFLSLPLAGAVNSVAYAFRVFFPDRFHCHFDEIFFFSEEMSGIHRSVSVPSRNALPPRELLDDLCSRFVLNCPKEDLQSFERILFLIEQAHWFYEDNAMEQNPSLKSLSLREFTSLMFQSCAALRPYIAHIDDIYKDFTSYKVRVPVTGAIILDESYERCLLVKGWKAGSSWSFPRGKKAKDEEDHKCAIREVFEETGFDVSKLLNVDENIEVVIGQQRVRLYIIGGVKEDTVFAPQTKKEISEIAWHRVDELQPTNNEANSRGLNGMKCFMVGPFMGPLKEWIAAHCLPATIKSDGSLKEPNQSTAAVVNEDLPGKSFRNFRFDSSFILRLLDGMIISG